MAAVDAVCHDIVALFADRVVYGATLLGPVGFPKRKSVVLPIRGSQFFVDNIG